jgi:hypothetical protein
VEATSVDNNVYYGIKGPTVLSKIVKIPEQVPFDPMHLIFQGYGKTLINEILFNKYADWKNGSKF